VRPPVTKPFAWSWSAVEQAMSCMRLWYGTRGTKQFTAEPGPALLLGRKVHDEMAKAVLGTGGLSEERRWVQGFVDELRKMTPRPLVEHAVSLDRSFRSTGKWSPDVWLRAVFDVLWRDGKRALVVDWKTGRRKEPSDQNLLLAAILYRMESPPEQVTTCYVWLEASSTDLSRPSRAEAEALLERLEQFPLRQMRELYGSGATVDDVDPSPSWQCRFCPVVTCQHHPVRGGK